MESCESREWRPESNAPFRTDSPSSRVVLAINRTPHSGDLCGLDDLGCARFERGPQL